MAGSSDEGRFVLAVHSFSKHISETVPDASDGGDTSVTNATYVISATHNCFGAVAVKFSFIKFGCHSAVGSGLVVSTRLDLEAPLGFCNLFARPSKP